MKKTHDIGCGWYATFVADGELIVHTHDYRTEFHLPSKSVDKLRDIFKAADAGKGGAA